MTNEVSYKEIATKSSEIITKFLDSEGFNASNNDFKSTVGTDLKLMITSFLDNDMSKTYTDLSTDAQ